MTATSPDDLRAAAEALATGVAEQTGERLDFSPASLGVLDAVLEQWRDLAGTYGDERPPDLEALVGPTAAYLGEVLIRSLGGCWVTEPDAPHVLLTGRNRSGEQPRAAVRVDVVRIAHESLGGGAGPAFAACFVAVRDAVDGGPAAGT
ncbi:MAG TPA: hypothetical protein VFN57_04575 [Thermomicrobiaceae bacterium]|nr:hypothetical protein [Thermomicrobiaceae bacterium]